jgi:hypothetical protein
MDKLWTLVKEGAQKAAKTAPTTAEITPIASDFFKAKQRRSRYIRRT